MGSEPTNLDVTINNATVATEVAYGTISPSTPGTCARASSSTTARK